VDAIAEARVRGAEGLFQSLFRSFFDDSQRRTEITRVAADLRQGLLAKHLSVLSAHELREREVDTKIQLVKSRVAELPSMTEEEIQDFLAKVDSPGHPKSGSVKLLRAFRAGLVNFDRVVLVRPDPIEYDLLKRRIRMRDKYRCVCCLRGFEQGELHVHHVIPLSRYGTNSDANLATLCHPCHNKQHPNFQVTRTFPIRRRSPNFRFVACDIETTGLSNSDSIIEIAAVKFSNGDIEEVFSSLVRSKVPVPPVITRITGITQAMVTEAPHPESVIKDFIEFIRNHQVIFHNASFDMRFIKRYLNHFGQPIPTRIIDTLQLARRKLPDLPNHRLATLVEHFGIRSTGFHRASDDSISTGHLYLALRKLPPPKIKKKTINKSIPKVT
jgi:DNA polymerase III epsilon subunit family exonuclease